MFDNVTRVGRWIFDNDDQIPRFCKGDEKFYEIQIDSDREGGTPDEEEDEE
jgi:hypothetical protein